MRQSERLHPSRQRTRRTIAVLPLAVLLAGLALTSAASSANASAPTNVSASAPTEAASTPSKAKLRKRAKVLAFEMHLQTFRLVKNHQKFGRDTYFDWNDDGCSLPRQLKSIAHRWDRLFTPACKRHDFGYRNFGKGLMLASNAATKYGIDSQFLTDMKWLCTQSGGSGCGFAAKLFYLGVHKSGQAQTAFYNRFCPDKRLCLFDDTGYADRRVNFTHAYANLKYLGFNDKASAVKNNTGYAFLLFEDAGANGSKRCIPAGDWVSDLGSFGDETSSLVTLSTCPS